MVDGLILARSALAGRPLGVAPQHPWPTGDIHPETLGTVFGVVLNSMSQLKALEAEFTGPPYGAPPRAPVLYIKSPNTYLAAGGIASVPDGVERLEVNAVLAVLFGREASRVGPDEALAAVAGYAVAIDVCVPHDNYYRPAVRQRCRDGFLPIGSKMIEPGAVADLYGLESVVTVNGIEQRRYSFADLARPTRQLISDISDFMTFAAGDALLVGLAPDGATAAAGDHVVASIAGFGQVDCRLEAEARHL
jgi:5-oxopent-3-ene-1,2,5-tricarboxylate decarboxylase/2-hydroxyhepta-2,4-diene-1,7-dioate isomerase